MKNKFFVPLLFLSLALIFSFTAGTVSAASTSTTSGSDVIYVNDSGGSDDNNGTSWEWAKKSIKNATGTVNTNGTINIADGTYTGVNNTNILIDRNMTIQGQSREGTIIDAQNSGRMFYTPYGAGVDLTLINLTLRNGNSGGASGGAIVDDNGLGVHSTLNITNCTFENNHAGLWGGAIYSFDVSLNIINSSFTGNTAPVNGGAIVFGGDSTIHMDVINTTFNGNAAANGGAIHTGGTLTVKNSTFTGNTAANYGGAIYNGGTLTVTGSNFTGNTANGQDRGGAAIFNSGTLNIIGSNFTDNDATVSDSAAIDSYGGILNITGSTFTNNEGGAIVNEYHGTLNVISSTFTGNTAIYDGGAIWNEYGSTCTVTGSTFTGNAARNGGAIWNSGTLTVNFCRIVGNTASGDGDAIYNYNEQPANAENNWWGSNNPDFDTLISGMPNPNYWLYMTINANPTTIKNGETSLITVSFNNLFDGEIRTDLDPTIGHIPDGSPVNFQTDLGTIGCKSIDKTTTGGIATAILTATELAGIAHINATTDNQTLFVNVTITPKAGLYLTVTPSKTNPVPGDTVVYTLKVGNKGPDAAKDVVMTYVIPEGLEFAGAKVDVGEWNYDAATRTITWNISDVPVGDPYMWLSLHIAQSGHYIINPVLSTSTYDPTLNSDTQSITVNAAEKHSTVKAASKTIPLQKTGMPLAGFVLAILAVFGGLATSKKF